MIKMNIKKDDVVVVLSGKDKGKQGKVQVVIPSDRKVVVEGVNIVTCHPEGSPPVRLQGAARLPQVQQAHPARSQAAGRWQEGQRLQEVRR